MSIWYSWRAAYRNQNQIIIINEFIIEFFLCSIFDVHLFCSVFGPSTINVSHSFFYAVAVAAVAILPTIMQVMAISLLIVAIYKMKSKRKRLDAAFFLTRLFFIALPLNDFQCYTPFARRDTVRHDELSEEPTKK